MKSRMSVDALWDEEAGVWVATSHDVPGLATEARTLARLAAKLRTLAPELMHANGRAIRSPASLEIRSRRLGRMNRLSVRLQTQS